MSKPSLKRRNNLLIALTILLLTTVFICVYLSLRENDFRPGSGKRQDQFSQVLNNRQIEIIKKLESDFDNFQGKIPLEPVSGASEWYGPSMVQFVSDNTFLISFEDGHVIGVAIVEYESASNAFTVLKAIPQYKLKQETWIDLVNEFGQDGFTPKNFTRNIWRNGKNEIFPDWTVVDENLFLE